MPMVFNNAIPPLNNHANLRQQERKAAGAIYEWHDFFYQ
jgi:hypothetical protein